MAGHWAMYDQRRHINIQPNYTIVAQNKRYLMRDWVGLRLRKVFNKAIAVMEKALQILSACKLAINKYQVTFLKLK